MYVLAIYQRAQLYKGYLSFWNDNISYALRGCILIELALRKRIAMVRDPNRRRYDLADRLVEVTNDKLTGEVLLDETLKLIKTSEKLSVGNWIDLLSGEALYKRMYPTNKIIRR